MYMQCLASAPLEIVLLESCEMSGPKGIFLEIFKSTIFHIRTPLDGCSRLTEHNVSKKTLHFADKVVKKKYLRAIDVTIVIRNERMSGR